MLTLNGDVAGRLSIGVRLEGSNPNLLEGYPMARRRREGFVVVLAGAPNVGKSSLANALLGEDRMIVTGEAGTTRDSVEEGLELGGISVVLTDTAGVRRTPSPAETEAVSRARRRAEDADLVVAVVDRSRPWDPGPYDALPRSVPTIVALNKTDLPARLDAAVLRSGARRVLEVSAKTGAGLDDLRAAIAEAATGPQGGARAESGAEISRARHRTAVERAAAAVDRAAALMDAEGDAALVSLELREALAELASITLPVDNEEILDHVFSEFCIGK